MRTLPDATEPDPFDPRCQRYASTMAELDDHIWGDPDLPGAERRPTRLALLAAARASYVRSEEGTYNRANGHFLCDSCYIDVGQPSSPTGWVCP